MGAAERAVSRHRRTRRRVYQSDARHSRFGGPADHPHHRRVGAVPVAVPRISTRAISFDAIIFTAPRAGRKVECNARPHLPARADRAVSCCSGTARVAVHSGSASLRRRLAAELVEVVRPAGIVHDDRDRGNCAGRAVRVELSFAQCPPVAATFRSWSSPASPRQAPCWASARIGSCHDATHPVFFQPLIWTVSLVKGGVSDFTLGEAHLPQSHPGRVCGLHGSPRSARFSPVLPVW